MKRVAENADRAVGIDNIAVWINHGNPYAEVTDTAGTLSRVGHHRPDDVHKKWIELLEKMHSNLRSE